MNVSSGHLISKILLKSGFHECPAIAWFLHCVFYYRVTQWIARNFSGEASPSHARRLVTFFAGISNALLIPGERASARRRATCNFSHCSLLSRMGIRSIGSMCLCRPAASDAPDTILVKSACPCRQHAELCLRTCPNQAWHSHVSCSVMPEIRISTRESGIPNAHIRFHRRGANFSLAWLSY